MSQCERPLITELRKALDKLDFLEKKINALKNTYGVDFAMTQDHRLYVVPLHFNISDYAENLREDVMRYRATL